MSELKEKTESFKYSLIKLQKAGVRILIDGMDMTEKRLNEMLYISGRSRECCYMADYITNPDNREVEEIHLDRVVINDLAGNRRFFYGADNYAYVQKVSERSYPHRKGSTFRSTQRYTRYE